MYNVNSPFCIVSIFFTSLTKSTAEKKIGGTIHGRTPLGNDNFFSCSSFAVTVSLRYISTALMRYYSYKYNKYIWKNELYYNSGSSGFFRRVRMRMRGGGRTVLYSHNTGTVDVTRVGTNTRPVCRKQMERKIRENVALERERERGKKKEKIMTKNRNGEYASERTLGRPNARGLSAFTNRTATRGGTHKK